MWTAPELFAYNARLVFNSRIVLHDGAYTLDHQA